MYRVLCGVKHMWKEYEAAVQAVLVARRRDTFVTSRVAEAELDYGGIPGDLHFGLTKRAGARERMYPRGTEIFNRRQITVVSVEECAAIAEKLGVETVLPEWLGANVAVKGFPNLTRLREGSRIVFPSGAGLLCEGENQPCIHPGKVIQGHYPDTPGLANRFVRLAMGLRGIVCIVERPGKIAPGETVKIVAYHPPKPKEPVFS